MKRIEDKFGNALLIKKIDDYFVIDLEICGASNHNLGTIYPDKKLFNVGLGHLSIDEEPVPLSAKFMVEAKTFNKVHIGGESITLNSLLYLLCLPHGMQVGSFAELVYIDTNFKFVQFKSRFEAMLYMCDIYEQYFNEHPPYPAKIGNIEVTDADKFVEVSLSFVRNLATLKKGGDPYFLQLTKYYNYARAHPDSNN